MDSFLEVRELSKSYLDGKGLEKKKALHGASFSLYKGEVFGLLGVNGAGKTTLSSLLATMHPPTSGDILWKGQSIYQQLIAYRKIVGICPQRSNIEKRLTLEENLLFAGRCYGLSLQEALEQRAKLVIQFSLEPYTKSMVGELSGGYQQRFLIARALMSRPEILILDEPTVGLDPHVRRQIWEVIATLKSTNVTIILTTHYLDEAEFLSDRVCLIHEGQIRTIDTPNNLKKSHQKNNLEEVFLCFVDDPKSMLFNAYTS
ncbi:MAG: ABC transporter ATP-binding protein [Chlamydiae bacterium]|nr:ABC transporter ATP-binding protein [Chlamydiota bacterium]